MNLMSNRGLGAQTSLRLAFFCLLLLIFTPATVAGQSVPPGLLRFRWLDPVADSALIGEIGQIFAKELQAEMPRNPAEPIPSRRILKVGVLGASALVVLSQKDAPSAEWDWVWAFNLNLTTKTKTEIETQRPLWEWKFYGLSQFAPSDFPDLLFTFSSCTECEATHYVGAFRFDAAEGKWELRRWGEQEGVFVGADADMVGDEIYTTDCIFRAGRLGQDQLDQLVVFCRVEASADAVGAVPRVLKETMSLYAVQDGRSKVREIKKSAEYDTLLGFVCATNGSAELCGNASRNWYQGRAANAPR